MKLLHTVQYEGQIDGIDTFRNWIGSEGTEKFLEGTSSGNTTYGTIIYANKSRKKVTVVYKEGGIKIYASSKRTIL